MQKTTIRLGYCPTRRDVFSREEAMRYGRLVKETLAGHPVELVDLAGINEEELLFRDADVPAVVEKFRAADVDALFFPHCNFGSENCVAQVARDVGFRQSSRFIQLYKAITGRTPGQERG